MENTGINWTGGSNGEPGYTHNPWTGCTKIDHECKHCYAEVQENVRWDRQAWGPDADRKRTSEVNRKAPLKWNRKAQAAGKAAFAFCASLADVMDDHPSIKQEWRDELIETIRQTPWLTWLLLSKRPENFVRFLPAKPLPNVWLGTTCGHDRPSARKRVEALRRTPIAPGCHRFLSAEPLLTDISMIDLSGISWVIAGGESGNQKTIRPMNLDHALSLYRKCKAEGIAFWFKQIGQKTVADGELLELVSSLHDLYQVPDEYRELCVRERPEPVVPLSDLLEVAG